MPMVGVLLPKLLNTVKHIAFIPMFGKESIKTWPNTKLLTSSVQTSYTHLLDNIVYHEDMALSNFSKRSYFDKIATIIKTNVKLSFSYQNCWKHNILYRYA